MTRYRAAQAVQERKEADDAGAVDLEAEQGFAFIRTLRRALE